MIAVLVTLLIAAPGPPSFDVFAECDYGRIGSGLSSAQCEQREVAAQQNVQQSWDTFSLPKRRWCLNQIRQRVQVFQYAWLYFCLQDSEPQPELPIRVRPYWGTQP